MGEHMGQCQVGIHESIMIPMHSQLNWLQHFALWAFLSQVVLASTDNTFRGIVQTAYSLDTSL